VIGETRVKEVAERSWDIEATVDVGDLARAAA
jgi:hypothetical protein